MDAKEIKEIRDRLQLLSSLVELDPRRKVLDEVRPKRLALQESLKEEQARRLAVLKAQAPPPRDLKRVRQLKAGELTQVGAGQVLRTLMEQRWENLKGRTPSELGFELVESDPGSALDWAGADFLLISPLGKFIALDVTCNPEKGWGIAQLPVLCAQGMLSLVDFPKWVDDYGVTDAEYQLRQELERKMPKLLDSASGSPLQLLDLRLPAGFPMGDSIWRLIEARVVLSEAELLRLYHRVTQARQAMEAFVADLEALAQGTPEFDKTLIQQYAAHVRRVRAKAGERTGPLHALEEQSHELNRRIQEAQRPKRPDRPSFRPDRKRKPRS